MKWVIVTVMIISNGQLQLSEAWDYPTKAACEVAADERYDLLVSEGLDPERFRLACYRVDNSEEDGE